MRLVQHAKEHFDLLDIQMLVVPEHSLSHIVNEMHNALIDSIQTNQVILGQVTIHTIMDFIFKLFELVTGLV